MKYLTIPFVLLVCAGCGIPNQTPSSSHRAQLDKARGFLAAGDADAALRITDEILNEGDLRPARLLAAEANLALATQGRKGTQYLLIDAAKHYQRALDVEPKDAASWMGLSGTYYLMGEYTAGRDAAVEAAKLFQADKERDKLGAALILASRHEMRILTAARQAELQSDNKDVQEHTRLKANAVAVRAEAIKRIHPGEGYLIAARVFQWLTRSMEELTELERGIRAAPAYHPLHTRLREWHTDRGSLAEFVSKYRRTLRDDGANAYAFYHMGIAQSALADKQRGNGDRESAQRGYLAAIQSFERCLASKPEWRQNCNHWLALEHIAIAKMNQEAGEFEVAKAHLKKAFGRTDRVLERDAQGRHVIKDSTGAHYPGTVNDLGNAVQSGGNRAALRAGLEFWEEFIALHPRTFWWVYNNAALNARDLGTAIEKPRDGEPTDEAAAQAAMALYERSYGHYRVAAELVPEDARTVNDCGLMLIYHLHRDYDEALKLFDQAIRVGLPKLEAMDESTSAEERNKLEEAIGDAYQNKGKLFRDQGKPFADCEQFWREAVKYYPYQGRQAARWLQSGGRRQAVEATTPRIDPHAATFAPVAGTAEKKADAKDYDGALLVLDAVSAQMAGYAPYHYTRGLYCLRYAETAVARANAAGGVTMGTSGQIDGLFGEARHHLQKAVDLDSEPIDPRLRLAQANYGAREYVNAAKIARELVLHVAARGGAPESVLAAIHKVSARSSTQNYIASKRANAAENAELQAGRQAFRNLESMSRLDLSLRNEWSALEQWAGDKAAALAIFERWLDAASNDQAMLGGLVETARTTQQSGEAITLLGVREDAVGLWYLGVLRYNAAYEAPARDNAKDAIAALDQAIATFAASATVNPAFEASGTTWIASCQGAQGFVALDDGQLGEAERYLLAAAKTDPSRVTARRFDNRSIKTGIELIVDHHYRSGKNLPAAIATLEKACAVIDNDPGLANNLGLFARDHGKKLEDGGEKEAAAVLFEKAYVAYKNALRMEPQSVRQRNDLAVMLVYHLKRELPQARRMLRQCIVDGERQLAEDPPEDPQERQDLDETIGDSYQNLGYYLMTFERDMQAARKNLEKSLTFFPFKKRASTRHLRKLAQSGPNQNRRER